MSWRIHTTSTGAIDAQVLSLGFVAKHYGLEIQERERNERALVLFDEGNQEMLVLRGHPTQRELFVRRVKRAVSRGPR